MTRRERLMATLRGEPVDRPAVSFYEINGTESRSAEDPYNIYSDPSWAPLLDLARDETDRIVMMGVGYKTLAPDPRWENTRTETVERGNSRFTKRRLNIGGRVLTSRQRQDRDINTIWTEEHLLKDLDDLKAFLQLPEVETRGTVETLPLLSMEEELGNSGIVMIDTPDPLCIAADLFSMSDYLVIAMEEPVWFHKLLERFAREIHARTAAVAQALPGRLWRIYGPEYATPPYLPPRLFSEYVTRYVRPMIEAIQETGGYARIHAHGNVSQALPEICAMGADAIDPLEPPPQGDVELRDVRRDYGDQLVLFGNLEVVDIENMPEKQFAEVVKKSLADGTAGTGRGFVLMPSACPYGRKLSPLSLRNYETMVRLTKDF